MTQTFSRYMQTRAYFGVRFPCADKPHKCPNRTGSGNYYPDEYTCDSGVIWFYDQETGENRRKFIVKCTDCGVKVFNPFLLNVFPRIAWYRLRTKWYALVSRTKNKISIKWADLLWWMWERNVFTYSDSVKSGRFLKCPQHEEYVLATTPIMKCETCKKHYQMPGDISDD